MITYTWDPSQRSTKKKKAYPNLDLTNSNYKKSRKMILYHFPKYLWQDNLYFWTPIHGNQVYSCTCMYLY
jgi:hypothetical protein